MKRMMAFLLVAFPACSSPPGENMSDLPPRVGPSDPPQAVKPDDSRKVRGLTLERALSMAERLHPKLESHRRAIEASEGRIEDASALPNPELALKMESAPLEGGNSGDAEYLVGISQRVPIGGRLGAAERLAELERERRIQKLEAARIEIHRGVHTAFAAALYVQELARVHASLRDIAQAGVEVHRVRVDAGDAVPFDLSRAEIGALRTGLAAEGMRAHVKSSLLALAEAVGDPGMEISNLEGDLYQALQVPSLQTVLGDLSSHPLLAEAEAAAKVAKARIDLVRAERIPDVTLEVYYRRIGETDTDALDVGLSVGLPVFNARGGTLRELDARAGQDLADLRGRRNRMERDARESHLKLTALTARAEILREQMVPRMGRMVEIEEARHAAGDISMGRLLVVRREHQDLQLEYLEALRDVMREWSTLKAFLLSR